MQQPPTIEQFSTLRQTAITLGLPMAWLKAEATAGRIPNIRAGKRIFFNCKAVEVELMNQAAAALQEKQNNKPLSAPTIP